VPKVNKRQRARDARIEALQLLGKWTRLAQGHVVLGGNCSCGLAGGSLPIVDFEQQILDYLNGKYAYKPGGPGNLGELLRSIAAQPAGTDSVKWLSLLDDLKRTLDSFDEQHRAP
jgi:hypothetical protein